MAHVPADRLAARVTRVRSHLAEAGVDGLLVTHLPNLFYLTGLRATAGAALLTPDRLLLLADFRYRATAEVAVAELCGPVGAGLWPAPRGIDEAAAEAIRTIGAARVGIEAANLTVARFDHLTRAVREAGAGSGRIQFVPTERLVECERVAKDDFEIGIFREAGRRLSALAAKAARFARFGRTELEVAADIDHVLRQGGFERPAFETIVASGPNGAFPHARPGNRVLVQGELVVLDFGGVYDGYCVDLSRTVSVGRPTDELVRLHWAVAEAQAAALAAVRPGIPASAVDAAARQVLERFGLAEAFGHGTGHGLGLEVHEEPRVARPVPGQPDAVLEPGMVVTIEPGVYVPALGGVRIEDDVLVTREGHERLTDVPRSLTFHLA